MNDKLLKEKLESVDALAGGVVYGRGQAWQKLEARLGKPPVKRSVLWLRIAAAAAAILLLAVTIALLTHAPGAGGKVEVAALPPSPPALIAVSPVADTQYLPIQRSAPALAPEIIRCDLPDAANQQEPFTVELPPAPPTATPADTLARLAVAPAPPAIRKMRVVHINDLGRNDEAPPADALVYTGPSLDISKMKVVSIYDVQHEEELRRREEDMIMIARINRPHGILGLSSLVSRPSRPGASPFAYSPFSIRLNKKN